MSKPSAAEHIRLALGELGPDATFRQVAEKLAPQGIEIKPQQVSNEKRKLRSHQIDVDDLPVSVLKQVKMLVDQIGSIEVIRKALDELETLIGSSPAESERKRT